MYWSPAKLVIFTSLVAATVVLDVTAVKCVTESSCSCHLPDGSSYDLGKVSSSPLSGEDAVLKYTFSFMPCKDVKMRLGYESPTTTEITACYNNTGVSLCAGHDHGTPFSLGATMETKWNIPEKGDPELVLTHGTNTTRITLSCCLTCVSKMTLNDVPAEKQFHFVLQSPHVCKVEGPPEGISTGSVLVILLFVFSGIYLLVGALVLRFFRGAIGWELIPNYDFWSDLPALVRDGVAFTCSGCSADSYDRI